MKYISLTCPHCKHEMRLTDEMIVAYAAEMKVNYFRCQRCNEKIDGWLDRCIFVDDSVSSDDYERFVRSTVKQDTVEALVMWDTNKPIHKFMSFNDMLTLISHNVISQEDAEKLMNEWQAETKEHIDNLVKEYNEKHAADEIQRIREGCGISRQVQDYISEHPDEFNDKSDTPTEEAYLTTFSFEIANDEIESAQMVVDRLNEELDKMRNKGYTIRSVTVSKNDETSIKFFIVTTFVRYAVLSYEQCVDIIYEWLKPYLRSLNHQPFGKRWKMTEYGFSTIWEFINGENDNVHENRAGIHLTQYKLDDTLFEIYQLDTSSLFEHKPNIIIKNDGEIIFNEDSYFPFLSREKMRELYKILMNHTMPKDK